MPLTPLSPQHRQQIEAGIEGRQRGHAFERELAAALGELVPTESLYNPSVHNLTTGHPAVELARYIVQKKRFTEVSRFEAWWVGGLATSGLGDHLLDSDGKRITRCKSDIVVRITHSCGQSTVGASVKTCNKTSPTNDQLFCSTAYAICELLRKNGISVSEEAETALRMFCGDPGFRPRDGRLDMRNRRSDPDRWFWEELPEEGRRRWESVFTDYQGEITKLLLQKGYLDDPFPPEFLLHQRTSFEDISRCPLALFTIDELVQQSQNYSKFGTRSYYIRKGRFKGDPNPHSAPRFGFIQMQRLGNKQNATQLQFNLRAGYFNMLGRNDREDAKN